MTNRIHNLATYQFASSEKIFIDTNIWLYLLPAPISPHDRKAKTYSIAFQKLIQAQAKIIIDPLVISEYINSYCRFIWNAQWKMKHSVYKDFRDSQDGRNIICDAARNAKKILSLSELHNVPVSKLSMENILNNFSSASLDFNDAIFVDICKSAGLKLMTHDKDFNSIGLEILTVNYNLLTRSGP